MPFGGGLLRIHFHFDTVLYSDLDAWGWGLCMRWSGGEQGALTRYRGRRAGMGESGRAPIKGLLWGCGNGDLKRRPLRLRSPWSGRRGHRGLDRRRIKAAGRWGGGIRPRRRRPTGTPPGALGPVLRVWGHAGWMVFRKLVSEDSRRSVDYPVDPRRILSLGKPSGSCCYPGSLGQGFSRTLVHPGRG